MAVATLVAVVLIAPAVLATHRRLAGAPPSGAASCLGRSSFVAADGSPTGFTEVLDKQESVYPQHIGLGPPSIWVSRFSGGRMVGLVSTRAFGQPYRGENDALARSLGYRVGRDPLVPLQGSIVRDIPGVLEIYESIYQFADSDVAAAWMSNVLSTWATTAEASPAALPPSLEGYSAHERVLGPDDGYHERSYVIEGTVGRTGFVINFQGGSAVGPLLVARPAEVAVDRIKSACR